MEVPTERAKGRSWESVMRRYERFGHFFLLASFLMLGSGHYSWAVQQHAITPEQELKAAAASQEQGGVGHAMAAEQPVQHAPEGAHGGTAPAPGAAPGAQGSQPQQGAASGHEAQKSAPKPSAPAPGGAHEKGIPEAGVDHGAESGHGPALPQISPVPGVTFVETMIDLMEHELHDRFLGWRPNDIITGQFTDDVNNYQLGVLEALRFTTLRLKDSLTRMGDADSYDPDLEHALNLFMNRATSFWFPSAESSYSEAVDHLRIFLQKLKSGQRNFYYRKDNLVSLLATYKDILGNVNRNLISSNVSWFKTDDYFYYAKGVAHVYYEILRVVRVGYQGPLTSTMNAVDIMDEILHELHRAEEVDPWLILDSDLDSFFANHRANLNAPLSEAAHLLGILSAF